MAILHNNSPSTQLIPTKFLAIDEEGYFLLDGLRMADQATGAAWLARIRMDDRGRAVLTPASGEALERIVIEAFDQPLVALDIEVQTDPPRVVGRFPYEFETEIDLESFRSDEWDRFYARTKDGVPLVLNRSAQSRLFQNATEFDDESVTFGEITLPVKPLYEEFESASQSDWWSGLYETGDNRWDLGEAHKLLSTLVPPLKISRSRILVLGCGAGHDAAWWANTGHIVTAVDFSEEAIAKARATYGESETLRWVCADAFNLPTAWTSRFDIVFEHTLFCAISPDRREELVRVWWKLLTPRGRLMGFVPVMDKLTGPPFGTSEWEMRRRLLEPPKKQSRSTMTKHPRFIPLVWTREKNSIEKRLGHELFFFVERADSLTE